MNYRHKISVDKFLEKVFPVLKWVISLLLVIGLSSCAEKVSGQDVSIRQTKPESSISPVARKFSETPPPEVIQQLSPYLENYQPQVIILTPAADEVITDDTVKVRFQVKDLPIFKDPQWQLGPHLHVVLDNQPYIAVYDLNKPLVLSKLSAGTHTLRVFASRPWHESFKNEGAYAQINFHVLTKSDDNNPDPNLPLLTYSRPNGGYGAEPIMLDFYLTNAPLHITAEDYPENPLSDWRIRCTINDESFVLDRWQTVYLKGFKPGKNWVKLEFLDNQGNPVKNVFNSTVRLIDYQPNGKDTLARIVRGEVTADEVRGIVDPNYTTKIPVTEPTPVVTPTPETKVEPKAEPKVEKTPVPEIEVSPTPETKVEPKAEPKVEKTPVPEIETSPTSETQVEPKVEKTPVPEIETSPTPETQVEPKVEPKVEKTPVPEIETSPTPETRVEPKAEPKVEKTPVPEIETSPTPETQVEPKVEPKVEKTPVPEVEVSPSLKQEPTPETEVEAEKEESKLEKTGLNRLGEYFKRKPGKTSVTLD